MRTRRDDIRWLRDLWWPPKTDRGRSAQAQQNDHKGVARNCNGEGEQSDRGKRESDEEGLIPLAQAA
jgi:hypothetical protein